MSYCRRLLVALSLLIASTAFAQDDWTGKRVILKRPGLKIGYSDDNGKQVHVAELTELSYPVLKESSGFVRLRHGADFGWLAKSEVLLPDEAIPYFAEQARRAKADDGSALAFLGWAYKERKQLDLALAAYDDAIKRDPRPSWFNNRGLIHKEAKKLDLALADFGEALKRAPRYVDAFKNRALVYGELNKLIPALDDWNSLLRLEPANGPALMERARVYVKQGELDKAALDVTAILKDDPANVDVLLERGRLHVDLNKIDAALADFSEAIRLKKTNVDALLIRSQLYTDRKDYAKAIADAENAMRVAPKSADPVQVRGWNRFLSGDFEQAGADFARALELDPKHVPTLNFQAWLWATCPNEKYRDGKKALERAKKAVELSGGKEPAILETEAAALAETGDFDAAVALQERVVRAIGTTGEHAAEARARLAGYRKKQPYRQPIAK